MSLTGAQSRVPMKCITLWTLVLLVNQLDSLTITTRTVPQSYSAQGVSSSESKGIDNREWDAGRRRSRRTTEYPDDTTSTGKGLKLATVNQHDMLTIARSTVPRPYTKKGVTPEESKEIDGRKWDDGRRRPRRGKTTLNPDDTTIDDMPSAEKGPKRGKYYNPSVGHEPYWVNGSWVFMPPKNESIEEVTTRAGETTTPSREPTTTVITTTRVGHDPALDPNRNCGAPCGPMYKRYGPICGRNANNEVKTFENYCTMLSIDCTGRRGWIMVLRGQCEFPSTINPDALDHMIEELKKAKIIVPNDPDLIGIPHNYTLYSTTTTTVTTPSFDPYQERCKLTFSVMVNLYKRIALVGKYLPSKNILFAVLSLHFRIAKSQTTTATTSATSTTTSIQDAINSKNLAIRERYTFKYNPHLGYEPYWVDGEPYVTDPWIAKSNQKLTTTTAPIICGDVCHPIYQKVKEVCGRWSDNSRTSGCWPPIFFDKWCTGRPGDQLTDGFETFPTYCAFLARNCRMTFIQPRYIFMHIGKCRTMNEWFKPMFYKTDILSRLSSYSLVILTTKSTTTTTTTTTPKPAG
ncbi:uncharacterized protein LOC142981290 [Anticarsia gemmatalis]|uniref:uncharacterized protein LOC142981290 n=1 Tax=Anticarsia gemmatalis TaxID=129554 RepID=UPI003F76B49A